MSVFRTETGNGVWRDFQNMVKMGRGESYGKLPRGGAQCGATPTDEPSQLPDAWAREIPHASHVVYHYGTPVAWRDERDGEWAIPAVQYSVTSTACQNRLRRAAGTFRAEPLG